MAGRVLSALVAALPLTAASSSAAGTQQLRGLHSANATTLLAEPRPAPSSHLVWSPSIKYCLSSDGNEVKSDTKVHLWECDDTWRSVGQNFQLDGYGLIKMAANPDYCVVPDGDHKNGARIRLGKCSHHPRERWSFQYSGNIQLSGTNMCLVIDANKAKNGAKIQLWECSGTAAQDWVRLALGPGGRNAFAVPNKDSACRGLFNPVNAKKMCAVAAQALQPDAGCYGRAWSDVVYTVEEHTWPLGCMFYGAAGNGCGLDFNPVGKALQAPKQDGVELQVLCAVTVR